MTLKLTVIGNVTRDAELRNTQDGESVLSFSLARNDRRTKLATYVDCSVWGKLGKSLEPYVKKGQRIYCDGELGTREHNGKTYLTCRVRDIELLGSKADGDQEDHKRPKGTSDLDDVIPF